MPPSMMKLLAAAVIGFLMVPPMKGRAQEDGSLDREGPVIEVNRIWDQAKHNAFTDLVRFQDKWYCVFREGSGHISADGALRVLVSDDAKSWESAALLTSETADLRDAKITITPDQQLMLSGAGAQHDASSFKHQSYTWFSSNGTDWSEAYPVADKDFWLWRTTWHQGTAYGLGYATGKDADRKVRLYTSKDGKDYDVLVDNLFDEGYPNETAMVFLEDDTCYCLLRRDGSSNTAQLGISAPPYREWTWKDLGVRIGGPDLIQIPDGRFIAGVRLYDGGARTSLCWLDPEQGKLTEFAKLPSGGDTSYPGMVWHDGQLWVSYYSGHEASELPATTSIYLARVVID